MALTMIGVFIAQFFRLQHAEQPNMVFGYYVLGIPLAVICIGGSMVILALGVYRFWRQQNAMLRGKVHAGGWETSAVGLLILVVCIAYRIFYTSISYSRVGDCTLFCASDCGRYREKFMRMGSLLS